MPEPELQRSAADRSAALLRLGSGQLVPALLALQRQCGNRQVADLVAQARARAGGYTGLPVQRLAERTVDGVTFNVESLTPELTSDGAWTDIGGLLIDTAAPAVTISGQRFQVKASVKAKGDDPAKLRGWKLGFIQTVFESTRQGFYNSPVRTKRTISLPHPMRDGLDSKVEPWFSGPRTADMAAFGTTVTTGMDDRAGFDLPKTDPKDDSFRPGKLDHTEGNDKFGCWLILWNPASTSSPVYLQYVPWSIDFATTCGLFDRVEKTGAGTTMGTVADGQGDRQAILTGPVPIGLNQTELTKDTTW